MEAHNGALTVTSTEDRGSTFFSRLPLARPLIFVAEDEVPFRFLVKKHLEEVDADILEAGDGEEALDLLKANSPHFIITDLVMPKMGGFRLLREVRKNPKAESILVVVLTLKTDLETNERAYRARANDVVTKPYDPENFIPRMRSYIV